MDPISLAFTLIVFEHFLVTCDLFRFALITQLAEERKFKKFFRFKSNYHTRV